MAGAVLVAWVLLGDAGTEEEADDAARTATTGTTESSRERPEAEGWDPLVADLVAFVEEERGLEFEHPVPVEALSDEEFEARRGDAVEDLDEEEREEIERFTEVLRALGLVHGEVDLLAEQLELEQASTAGTYDLEEGRITVRRDDTDSVSGRVTLVHELTHALQDQHFDISTERTEDLETDSARLAFRALVEGDATRVQNAYLETLGEEGLAEYGAAAGEATEEIERLDVPPILVTLLAAPYGLGEGFVALLHSLGGQAAIDEAFAEPPTTEEHLLDPFTYVEGEESVELDVEIPAGAEEIDRAEFGALGLLLVLAERVDPLVALDAADGWGGDGYAAYRAGGRTCVRAAFTGDSADDTAEILEALEEWVDRMPSGTASARAAGDRVAMESCDPGAARTLDEEGASLLALELAAARTTLAAEVLTLPGTDRELARCFSDAFVREIEPEAFEELERLLAEGTEESARRAEELGASIGTRAMQRCL